jgi:acyl-CoA reductase-like NAD-dependent aldehyde dehydrogenase
MSTEGAVDGDSKVHVPLIIDGRDVRTGAPFDVRNPATGKTVWTASAALRDDAARAIEAAEAAFAAWSKTKPQRIRDIFLRAAEILHSRGKEAGGYMTAETSAPDAFAGGFNVPVTVEMLKDIAGRIVGLSSSVPVCGEEGKQAIVYKVPYGVVFGIAPWFREPPAMSRRHGLTGL